MFFIAVGVNDSSDRTAEIARRFPVTVAETGARGYGHGCQAAIDALEAADRAVSAYIFMAGDGASDPRDVPALVAAHHEGYTMVLGARTTRRSNWKAMSLSHVVANLSLGACCGLLTGRWFRDLAPLRLIDRHLFEAIGPEEMTFGWTIEAQVGAAILDESICEISVRERQRLGGQQKVSGVTWRRTFSIGCRIVTAGLRARRRFRRRVSRQAEVMASSSNRHVTHRNVQPTDRTIAAH